MARRELPLLDRTEGEVCCAPIRQALLSARDASTLARQFAALADPVRLQLLSMIATDPQGSVCACDLVEPTGRSQPTVSHHLKVLREAGLVASERRGVNHWYSAVPSALDSLRRVLASP